MRARAAVVLALFSVTCGPPPSPGTTGPERPWTVARANLLVADLWEPDELPLQSLLVSPDSVRQDSALAALLEHRLSLPARVTVAVVHLRGTRSQLRWYTPEQNEMNQALADSAVAALGRIPRVGRALVLPALLVDQQYSVASLREAAARLQAHALLVYRPACRLYERAPFVGSSQYRADCTLEALLLDTRAGVIPFSAVVTRDYITQRERADFELQATFRRAQTAAVTLALAEITTRLSAFLTSVPESTG